MSRGFKCCAASRPQASFIDEEDAEAATKVANLRGELGVLSFTALQSRVTAVCEALA